MLSFLFFLSDVLCAEALVADGFAVSSEQGRAVQGPNFSS
jgi:hypothetical protein